MITVLYENVIHGPFPGNRPDIGPATSRLRPFPGCPRGARVAPQRRLHNMAIAFKNQLDILCAMNPGPLYVLLTAVRRIPCLIGEIMVT